MQRKGRELFLYYIDESYDSKKFAMAAIRIAVDEWQNIFEKIKEFRRELKSKHGIYLKKEFHATEFVSGRGRLAKNVIPKGLRVEIFRRELLLLASLPVEIIAACIDRKCVQDAHLFTLERLFNRIEVNARKSGRRFILIIDEGKESEILKLSRKIRTHNPIPSQYGGWANGQPVKNIVLDRLIEDPIFKESHQSHFLQLADFVAFSLLKQEVPPTSAVMKYKLNEMYNLLDPILCKHAYKGDKQGIIREK